MWFPSVLLAGLACAVAGEAVLPGHTLWGPRETQALDEALRILNMTREDLAFAKKPVMDEVLMSAFPLTPPVVDDLLAHPLEAPPAGLTHARAIAAAHREGDLNALFREGLRVMSWKAPAPPEAAPEWNRGLKASFDGVSPEVLEILGPLLGRMTDARQDVERALKGLSRRDRAAVQAAEADPGVLAAAWGKVDQPRLWRAYMSLAGAVSEASRRFRALPPVAWQAGNRDGVLKEGALAEVKTPLGLVIIGGTGSNVYRAPAALIVDPGGNDRYEGSVAAGTAALPVSVLMDLAGDDTYASGDDLAQGAGLMGIGMLVDADGSDDYRAAGRAQGFARFGAGLLWDQRGADRYTGGSEVQGAASFGMGVLLDDEGGDDYRASEAGQAYAFVQGWGVLSDLKGNDRYLAGAVEAHKPLLPDRYRSLSQGCAFGHRFALGGGVAALVDAEGSDHYAADVFAQGVGYWLAWGVLADFAGHDTYSLTIYGQGSGIHSGIGTLLDLEGEDSYVAAHGLAQGAGHDLAVGGLVDLVGNDRYVGPGFSQGASDESSVGLFLDRKGQDLYMGERNDIWGYGTYGRGLFSVGLFLDLEGEKDVFASKPDADRTHELRGDLGLMVDWREAPPPGGSLTAAPPPPEAPPGETDLPDDREELFRLAARWQVGSNAAAVEGSRRKLIAGGTATLNFLIPGKLKIGDPAKIGSGAVYQMRALRAVLSGIGATLAIPRLLPYVDHRDPDFRRSAFELLGSLDAREAGSALADRLPRETGPLAILCIRTLAAVKATLAVPALVERLERAQEEGERLAILGALAGLPSPEALQPLVRVLEREPMAFRMAAQRALAAQGTRAEGAVRELLGRPEARLRIHGLELARLMKAVALEESVRRALSDREWVVQGYAVRALAALRASGWRDHLAAVPLADVHPFVRSQIASALAERPTPP